MHNHASVKVTIDFLWVLMFAISVAEFCACKR